jgi:transcriptional regulator with XRE-family HTH domain
MTKKAPNPIDKHVGSRVRMRRMLIGMSQEKFGEALGLTFQQVQKYEKGTNRIGASRLHQIAGILGITIDFLYQGAPRIGAASSGGADEQASADLSEFLSSSDGIELMRGFIAIKDARVRRRVVDLVASLGDQVGEAATAPALRRTGS